MFENASAHVFDSRSSTSTLAILLPLSSTLLLLTLSLSPDGKLVVTPLHQISAIAATPVLATRPNVLDLLFLSPDNSWGILSANGRSEAVVGPTLPEGRTVKTLDGNGSTQFVLTLDDGSRHTAALPPLPTGLALRIMHVVSAVIPLDDFLGFQREIVKWKQKDPSASYLEAIEGVFAVSFATSAPSPPSSDVWANFIDATNSSSASDPIVAGLLSSTPPPQPALGPATAAPTSREPLEAIILGLHLLIEDLKLLADTHEDYLALSALVLPLVAALGLPNWVDYYERKCGGSLRPLPLGQSSQMQFSSLDYTDATRSQLLRTPSPPTSSPAHPTSSPTSPSSSPPAPVHPPCSSSPPSLPYSASPHQTSTAPSTRAARRETSSPSTPPSPNPPRRPNSPFSAWTASSGRWKTSRGSPLG